MNCMQLWSVSQQAYSRTEKKWFWYNKKFIGGEELKARGCNRLGDIFTDIEMQK